MADRLRLLDDDDDGRISLITRGAAVRRRTSVDLAVCEYDDEIDSYLRRTIGSTLVHWRTCLICRRH